MRKQYSKKDIKELALPIEISKKDNIVEEDEKLYINNQLSFIKINNTWLPHLKLLLIKPNILPTVIVDMGAIKFVVKGADIMRPGITKISDFEKNASITIIDETHSKPLAVGQALLSSEDMQKETSGKVIKNLYYVGDKYW